MVNLHAIANRIGEALQIDTADPMIQRVSALSNAGPDSLVFIEDESQLRAALATSAAAILAPLSTPGHDVKDHSRILRVKQPKLAFARAAKLLAPLMPATIHSSAITGNATIGSNTMIAAGCVLADNVVIGRDCILHPRVILYAGTILGDRVIVHAGAVLGADGFGYVRDPATGTYLQFPQQGTLVIEDDVEIGANTTIDRGALEETRIGRGTKIDNLVHIGHNVRIGSNVVVAAQTGISGSCVIEDGAIIGGQVGMGDHCTIGAGVIIGSGAGILPYKHLQGASQVYWGVPAKPLKQHLKELAMFSKLVKKAEAKLAKKPEAGN